MVEDAPWRAHHHMGAVLQTHGLTSQGHAAAQGDHFDVAHGSRQASNFLCYLIGQFTRGAQHQRLGVKLRGVEFLHQGQAKGCRFAAARAGLRQQVASRQRERQAGRLNRRHRCVAQLGQVAQRGRR